MNVCSMPKQDFETLDYFGAVIVGIIFSVSLLFISFFVINFFCITKYDDITEFEKFGAKRNIRLGPHPLKMVKRGKFETIDDVEESSE